MSLQRRIGPIFRGSVGDAFNLAYDGCDLQVLNDRFKEGDRLYIGSQTVRRQLRGGRTGCWKCGYAMFAELPRTGCRSALGSAVAMRCSVSVERGSDGNRPQGVCFVNLFRAGTDPWDHVFILSSLPHLLVYC